MERERPAERPAPVPGHVAQNIETMATLHAQAEDRVGHTQKRIERLTAAIGRPRSLKIILAAVVGWTSYNALAPWLGVPQLDAPPFFWLQGAMGLSALLVTTMILTTQNRLDKRAVQRDHLDLQVNLVAEQKIAKIIGLIEELRRDIPSVQNRVDLVADAMTEAVDPHAVVSVLEETLGTPIDHAPVERASDV